MEGAALDPDVTSAQGTWGTVGSGVCCTVHSGFINVDPWLIEIGKGIPDIF